MSLALLSAGDVLAHALDHEARLVLLVVRGVHLDRRAGRAGGPQLLAEPVRIVRDHRVRGGEDVAGRAVVLFEADGLRAREIAQEMLHVLDARAAPAVDRLVVVADDEHLSGRRRRARGSTRTAACWCPGTRRSADAGSARGSARSSASLCSQQLVRAQQQLGEIDQPGALARVFVGAIDSISVRVDRIVSPRIERVRPLALVLRAVDEPAAWRGGKRASSRPRPWIVRLTRRC